jgi:hypothetical protein
MFGTNSKNKKIIREDIKGSLENYLSFRHFIRHAYSSELDWKLMNPLVMDIEKIWEIIRTDFEVFIKNN